VIALVESPGPRARVFHVATADGPTVRKLPMDNITRSSELHTDESVLYRRIGKWFADHKTVEH
jgi:hypothetical protein